MPFRQDFSLKASLKSLDHAPEIRIASKLDLEELPIVGIEEVQNIQTGLLLGGDHRPVGGIIHGDFGVGGAGKHPAPDSGLDCPKGSPVA